MWILAFRYLQRNFEVQNRYLDSFHSVKNLRSSSRNVFSPQNPFFQRFKSNYWFLSAYFWWRSTHCNPTPCNHHPMHVSKLCTFEDNWPAMSSNLRFLEKNVDSDFYLIRKIKSLYLGMALLLMDLKSRWKLDLTRWSKIRTSIFTVVTSQLRNMYS